MTRMRIKSVVNTTVLVVCLLVMAPCAQGGESDGVSDIGPPETLPEPMQVGEEILKIFETDHPYWGPSNGELQLILSVEIHFPGASYISPHFTHFDLIAGDFVVIRSPDGSRSWRYEGLGKAGPGRLV